MSLTKDNEIAVTTSKLRNRAVQDREDLSDTVRFNSKILLLDEKTTLIQACRRRIRRHHTLRG